MTIPLKEKVFHEGLLVAYAELCRSYIWLKKRLT